MQWTVEYSMTRNCEENTRNATSKSRKGNPIALQVWLLRRRKVPLKNFMREAGGSNRGETPANDQALFDLIKDGHRHWLFAGERRTNPLRSRSSIALCR